MADLHPFIVHFPVALISLSWMFDVYGSLRSEKAQNITAFILQIISAIFSLVAGFTGNLAENSIAREPELISAVNEALTRHRTLANVVIWLIILVTLARVVAILEKKEWGLQGWVFPLAGFLLAVLVILTGLYGGALNEHIRDFYIQH